jgi:hypothetical protein
MPYVDGVSLVDLDRPAKADRQPDLAGAYAGLVVGGARWQDWYPGVDPQVWFGDGDSCLLSCVCGDTGCWPLTAKITIGEDTVRWESFRTGHRAWDLAALGPFTFSAAPTTPRSPLPHPKSAEGTGTQAHRQPDRGMIGCPTFASGLPASTVARRRVVRCCVVGSPAPG